MVVIGFLNCVGVQRIITARCATSFVHQKTKNFNKTENAFHFLGLDVILVVNNVLSFVLFLGTRSEPTIFYLPAKQTKLTEELLADTRSAIAQKVESLKQSIVPEKEFDIEESTIHKDQKVISKENTNFKIQFEFV